MVRVELSYLSSRNVDGSFFPEKSTSMYVRMHTDFPDGLTVEDLSSAFNGRVSVLNLYRESFEEGIIGGSRVDDFFAQEGQRDISEQNLPRVDDFFASEQEGYLRERKRYSFSRLTGDNRYDPDEVRQIVHSLNGRIISSSPSLDF